MRFRAGKFAALIAAVMAASLIGPAQSVLAQTVLVGGPAQTLSLDGGEKVADLTIARGKSAPIGFDGVVRTAFATDSTIADVLPMSAGQFMVLGKAPGHTDIRFFDGAGRPILTVNVRVEMDVAAVAANIKQAVPNALLQVEAMDNSIILTGHADSISDADAAVQIARLAVGGKAENVLNRIILADKDQVMLKVRFVEVQRSVIKQFGVDLNALIGQVGSAQFNFANTASFAVNNGLQGGLSGGYKLDTQQQPELVIPCAAGVTGTCYQIVHNNTFPDGTLASNGGTATAQASAGSAGLNQAASTIKAFERNGLIRTLAEPDLTAVSGEAANFLAGGEFPVPIAVDQNGNTSVDFKPFGIGLGFTPVVLSGGRISLKLSAEVSELSSTGALTLQGAKPTSIPALVVRRANTTVELSSGGSMMIGGLLSETTRENIDKVPGVADMPVLGVLARSRDFLSGETEIVMIVTAYIVKPTEPGELQTPADGLRIATDAQTLLLGKLNQAYGVPEAAVAGRTYEGAFGHVIE